MEGLVLNKRYAKVLFDLALEGDKLGQVYTDIMLVKRVNAENLNLGFALRSQVVKGDVKGNIIREIFSGKVSDLTLQFILFVVRKGRSASLNGIILLFIDLYRASQNIKTATIYTATVVDDDLKEKIKIILEEYTQNTIEIESKIDKKIMGGFRIYFDGCLYDAALLTKLKKLNKSFSINEYEKLF